MPTSERQPPHPPGLQLQPHSGLPPGLRVPPKRCAKSQGHCGRSGPLGGRWPSIPADRVQPLSPSYPQGQRRTRAQHSATHRSLGADRPGPASAALGTASGAKTSGRTRWSLALPHRQQSPFRSSAPTVPAWSRHCPDTPWVPRPLPSALPASAHGRLPLGPVAVPTQDPPPATGSRGRAGLGPELPPWSCQAAAVPVRLRGWGGGAVELRSAEGFPLRGPRGRESPHSTCLALNWVPLSP